METSTVPVARDGLGLDGDLGTEFLGDAVKEEAGHPQLITHLDSLAGADLEFPLGGHNLGVGAGDLNAGVQACLIMGVNDVTAHNPASTDTTVVRALRSRETVLRPSVGSVLHIE